MQHSTALRFVGALVLVAAVGLGLWWFIAYSRPHYDSISTPTQALNKTSPDFIQGQQYLRQGDYVKAIDSYNSALRQAQDDVQKAQIQYNVALSNMKLGKYADAINQLKVIVDTPSAGKITQAYAAEQIGIIYYAYYDGRSGDNSIYDVTFNDEPYKSFANGADVDLAYRRLFEYSTGFYPVGYAESMIGYWYSNDLLGTQQGATTTQQGISDINAVNASIDKADKDIERTKNDPVAGSLIPGILAREGTTLGHLAQVGAAEPNKVESYFQNAIKYEAVLGNQAGTFTPYKYAAFLAQYYGKSRSADIAKLLSSFRTNNDQNIPPNVPVFYKTARTDKTLTKERAAIVLLGQLDPDFKSYLETLGWSEHDF